MKPIVRNIKTNDLYEYQGGDRFVNLRTGASGDVDPEKAASNFRFNLEATEIFNEYPLAKDLVAKLGLIAEKRLEVTAGNATG